MAFDLNARSRMTDPDLLSAALAATKLSARDFAIDVLELDGKAVREILRIELRR